MSIATMGNHRDESTFDAVIVGSGFGGSVMAYRLAKAKLNVCLLERGKKWPPGSFPRSPYALKKRAIWDPSRGLHGYFNLWQFKEIAAVIPSGLGGGSLIYANVFLEKDERWFVDNGPGGCRAWPLAYSDLESHYKAVRRVVNPARYPVAYRDSTPKTVAFREAAEAAGLEPFYPRLAITFSRGDEPLGRLIEEEENIHQVPRYTCRLVGECDAGCNYGSNNSLDFNYITAAWHLGAAIKDRHEVKSFAPPARKGGLFRVEVIDYTDFEEGREPERRVIFARRLILSAGSLGTTFLLLANRSAFPNISRQLGTRFSGNGDLLTFASHCTRIGESGEPELRVIEPSYGPVITMAARVADTSDGATGPGFYLEDGGYPAFLSWVQEMLDLPRFLWTEKWAIAKAMWRAVTRNPQRDLGDELAGIAGDRVLAAGTMTLLAMGHEIPQGTMRLDDRGRLDVDWSFKVAKPYNDRLRKTMKRVSVELGGEYKDDILWKLNQAITVHPLGGCPMGMSAEEGVVDHLTGQVFGYPGLHVADGSVMPGPVGANPSLTIAAVADRFADGILELEGRACAGRRRLPGASAPSSSPAAVSRSPSRRASSRCGSTRSRSRSTSRSRTGRAAASSTLRCGARA
ncbi:MAG: GMC oxidoreductase [Gaiellaceae bacterium]